LIDEKSFTVISSDETNGNAKVADDTQTNALGSGNVSGNDFLNRFISNIGLRKYYIEHEPERQKRAIF